MSYDNQVANSEKPRLQLKDVKSQLAGRAVDVLVHVAEIPPELLDGRHHGCPNCGGDDRFRLIDEEQGAVLCNQCFSKKNGDAIAAVKHFQNISMPEALRRIAEFLGLTPLSTSPAKRGKKQGASSRPTRATRPTTSVKQTPDEITNQPDELVVNSPSVEDRKEDQGDPRHEIYQVILSGLYLSDEHREALHQRGMSDDQIESGEYRSVTSSSRTTEASRRLRDWIAEDPGRRAELALTVPGVLQDEGKPIRFNSQIGLLVPVRDTVGNIIALRIRLDNSHGVGKYRWITSRSSKRPLGASPGSPCHVPLGIASSVETARVTEGELKADIANRLSGIPTVSIAGVNTWARVLPLIETLKPKRILIALDADFRTNPAVADALRKLVTSFHGEYEVGVETWPLEEAKGIDDLLAAGLSPTILMGDDVAELLNTLPQSAASRISNSGYVDILIGADEHRVNDEAIAELANIDMLFARSEMLTLVGEQESFDDGVATRNGSMVLRIVQPATLREIMTRCIRFKEERMTPSGELIEKIVHPPGWCVGAVHARGTWPKIRPIRSIVNCPTIRPDGSILTTNGYDPQTALFLASSLSMPPIPTRPTKEDAIQAAEKLLEIVSDFPFETPEHCSAWLALVLTQLARHAFSGPSPLFLIDANTRGSGKSLLADVVGIITTGTTLPRMSNPKDDDECRKRITSLALDGASVVLIDNINGSLGCASLDAALTSPDTWKDRILGKTEMVELPLSMTWMATGNNVMLEADTCRRTLHIRLESPEENPELRQEFRFPLLLQHVKQHRAELVAAGLTILSAYHAAGRPQMDIPAWGSFESWSALIREAIVWCGLPDPGQTRQQLTDRSDAIVGTLQTLIHEWPKIDPDYRGLTAAELLRELNDDNPDYQSIREAICELCDTTGDQLPSARSLGNRLKQYRGRVVRGMTLTSINQHGMARWIVKPIKTTVAGCSGGSGGSATHSIDSGSEISVCRDSSETQMELSTTLLT